MILKEAALRGFCILLRQPSVLFASIYVQKHFMKKLAVILVSVTLIISCTKGSDSTSNGGGGNYTPSCTGTAKSFSADVFPIFQNVCSASGCHNSGSSNGPGALTNYNQIFSARRDIRAAVLSGEMPENSTLSTAQKNNIICWIDSGAPNN